MMNKAIHTKTQEQFNTVLELFKKWNWTWVTGEDPLQGTERWTTYKEETCISAYGNKLMFSSLDYYKENGFEIISFEEFMNEINNKLPEKWCIAGAHSDEIIEWFTETIGRKPLHNISSYFHYPLFDVNGAKACTSAEIQEGYTEISLQYFRDNILKPKEMKNKKIIGYKLKDQKYFIPASLVIFNNDSGLKDWAPDKYMSISEHQYAIEKAKEEGILNLWFEPVYQKESKYFGNVEFRINSESITADTKHGRIDKKEVKRAINYIENPPSLAGFNMSIHREEDSNLYSLKDLADGVIPGLKIGFGCEAGDLNQLKAIYNIFN